MPYDNAKKKRASDRRLAKVKKTQESKTRRTINVNLRRLLKITEKEN